MNRGLQQQLQHLYLAGDTKTVGLVEAALDDEMFDRNCAAIDQLEQVEEVFNERHSEEFDELLDELADQLSGHLGVSHPLYTRFTEFQTELLKRSASTDALIKGAIDILEGKR